MKTYFRILSALLWKEFKCESRRREMFPSMLVFSCVILILFHFTLSSHGQFEAQSIAGILWVTFSFAGILGLNRSLALEQEAGLMDGLLLVPVDRSVLFVSKLLANWLTLLLLALVFLPLVGLFFGSFVLSIPLMLVVFLGTLGYAITGSLLAGMAMQSRMRDTLLSILLFPILLPLLLAAVKASSGIFQNLPSGEISPWIQFMLVYDVIFFAIGLMTYPVLLEE
jgi:heme exporter protein B